MKKCFKCKTTKELELFYKNKSTNDGYSGICRSCQSHNEKINNAKTRDWLIGLKTKCSVCDECRWWCLDFHHVDPKLKTMDVSNYSISGTASHKTKVIKISKELENCIILCSNCHRDYHYQQKLLK